MEIDGWSITMDNNGSLMVQKHYDGPYGDGAITLPADAATRALLYLILKSLHESKSTPC